MARPETSTQWPVRKVLVLLVLACLIPGVIGAAILSAFEYIEGRKTLERDAVFLARALVQAVDSQLVGARTAAELLAASPYLRTRNLVAFDREAREILQAVDIGNNLVLSDASGQQLINTLRAVGEPLPKHGNMPQLLRVFANGKPLISDLYLGGVTRRPVLSVDVPVRVAGHVLYDLSIGILPERLSKVLLSQRLPGQWIAGVFDSNGVIAARTHQPNEFVGKPSIPEYVSRVREVPEGTLVAKTLEGVDSLIVYSSSPVSNWSVAIAIPRHLFEEDLRRTIGYLALGIGLLFALGTALAWKLGGRIAGSVQALAGPAQDLGAGKPVQAPPVMLREAADVAQAMEQASQLLNQRAQALKKTNADLLESETRFRSLADTAPVLIWLAGADSLRTWFNQGWLDFTGRTMEADLGSGWTDDVHPDDLDNFLTEYAKSFDRQEPFEIEYRLRKATGDYCWVLCRAVPQFAAAGHFAGFIGCCMDISLQKSAEQKIRAASEAAEAASKAKSAFLANMSHEIRTPLSVVVGLAHLLHRDIEDPLQRQRLKQLCATSEHLMALINDILDLSRIEAERLVLAEGDFSLGRVVKRVTRMLEDRAREKGLSLRTDVAAPLLGASLHGDALRLAQVLINLCGNAIKFTEKGTVSLSIACVSESTASVTLRFTVADTGCGIAPADQARLFEPFAQGDASATRQYGGAGLGLTISKQLVALMGGTIRVDSQAGAGSVFSFELVLPRATVDARLATAAPAAPVPTSFHGTHILFAEDHAPSREIVLEMLDSLGCETDLASNGAEAVESARAGAYDLILMDMQMPGMDGLTATRAIRALPGHGHTPIIALTANAFAEDRQRCLDAGMNAHLGKPVTPSTLAAALGQYLPGRPVSSDAAAACDSELSCALLQIQGLDVGPAWRRSPEMIVAYRTQLERFINAHEHQMTRLREHLAAAEHDAARDLAHNLKGIAGLVGAQRVAALASKIEQGLRTGATKSAINYRVRKCAAELARLAQALRELPAPAAESASPSQKPPHVAG